MESTDIVLRFHPVHGVFIETDVEVTDAEMEQLQRAALSLYLIRFNPYLSPLMGECDRVDESASDEAREANERHHIDGLYIHAIVNGIRSCITIEAARNLREQSPSYAQRAYDTHRDADPKFPPAPDWPAVVQGLMAIADAAVGQCDQLTAARDALRDHTLRKELGIA